MKFNHSLFMDETLSTTCIWNKIFKITSRQPHTQTIEFPGRTRQGEGSSSVNVCSCCWRRWQAAGNAAYLFVHLHIEAIWHLVILQTKQYNSISGTAITRDTRLYMEGQTFCETKQEQRGGGGGGAHTTSTEQTARDQKSCVVSQKYDILCKFVDHPKVITDK